MNGRSFACFSRIRVAWTSAWASASSGRFRRPVAIRSSSGQSSATRRIDRLGRLDRGDHDPRVEPDPADQLGRGDLQLADGGLDVPALAVALGQDPAVVGLQARPGPGVGGGQLGQGLGVGGGLAGDRQRPGGLLEVEVRLGHAEQGVVGRGPDPGLPGGDDPPGGQRLEDRVGDPQDRVRPETCAGPPAGTGPETLDPAAAVAPRNSELLLIDWTWPWTIWAWPSWRIQFGPR